RHRRGPYRRARRAHAAPPRLLTRVGLRRRGDGRAPALMFTQSSHAGRKRLMRRASVLTVLAAALAIAVAGCGGGSDGDTTEASTTTSATGSGDAAAGKEVFASAGCGGCHTFSAAGSSGSVGPNLDHASPAHQTLRTPWPPRRGT